MQLPPGLALLHRGRELLLIIVKGLLVGGLK